MCKQHLSVSNLFNLVRNEYGYDENIHYYDGEFCWPFPPMEMDDSIPFGNEENETTKSTKAIPEYEYEHKNCVIIYSLETDRFMHLRLPIKDIVVTKGMIQFIFEVGNPICIRDDAIIHNICDNYENSSTSKYESFMGKTSILKYHFDNAVCNHRVIGSDRFENADFYKSDYIIECIHDGVTTFIMIDEHVQAMARLIKIENILKGADALC